ncbi:MAG: stage V sporulation protein E [Clostridia bacterium]|nr:stage V sporulation protein E [Clostridia bacterium]
MSVKNACDYTILLDVFLLLAIGVIIVYSSSFYYAYINFNDSAYFLKRQLLWSLIGLFVMIFMMNFDYWKLRKLSKPALIISFFLLVVVFVLGLKGEHESHGATRWIRFGGVGIQPSEVAKISMIIYLASSLDKKGEKIKSFKKGLVPYLVVLSAFFGLILLQPDLSTAVTLATIVFIMLYISGADMRHLVPIAIIGFAAAAYFVTSEDYRMRRFLAFIDPWADPGDTGYHIIQSLYALGSGGLFGTGLTGGKQNLLYLPEAHTDSIFSILGEQLGFVGCALVILLFIILIWRGIKVAVNSPDMFGCLLASGIVSLIGVQAAINIAVATSSIPPTGIPLPFISSGGSSLVITLAGMGILLNISKYAKLDRG